MQPNDLSVTVTSSCAWTNPGATQSMAVASATPPIQTCFIRSLLGNRRRVEVLITSALLVEERDQSRNHLIGRFLHQPVARPLHHHTLDVVVDEAALFDEEFAPRLLAAQAQHRHGERRLGQLRQLLSVPLERAKPLHAGPAVPSPS